MDPCPNVVPARPADILPPHIVDAQAATITVLLRVNARCDVNGLVYVVELDVAEGDVVHAPLACVGLDPGCVGRVNAFDVFEEDVVDVIDCVVANGADDHASRLVAGDVVDVHVGRVSLRANAVLPVIVSGRIYGYARPNGSLHLHLSQPNFE